MNGVRTCVSRHRYLQAVRYDEDSEADLLKQLGAVREDENGPRLLFEGGVTARRGDWIVRSADGLISAIDASTFRKLFEPIYV